MEEGHVLTWRPVASSSAAQPAVAVDGGRAMLLRMRLDATRRLPPLNLFVIPLPNPVAESADE